MTDFKREKGKRIKTWSMDGDEQQNYEGSYEYPVMYRWLGVPPRFEHPYNMYEDVSSQPKALRDTINSIKPDVKSIAKEIVDRGINRIIGTGLGTSQFVSQAAAGAFWKYAGIDSTDIDSLEYFHNPRPYEYEKICFAVLSGSGSTTDSNRAGRLAKEMGAFTLAITSVDGSPVTQFCDRKIVCSGGFDTAGGDSFHYTTRTLALIMLAIEIGKLRQPDKFDYDAISSEIESIPDRFAKMFDSVDQRCRSIAKQHNSVRANIVVGNGSNFGAAEEMSLKFDEMAHLPSKGMVLDRHIHGALGLTANNILTILIVPKNDTGYTEFVNIADFCNTIKSPSIAIVSSDDNEISNMVDDVIRIPMDTPELFPLLAILPGQLLPYWSSIYSGYSPDTQRSEVPNYGRAWGKMFPKGTH